MGRMRRMDACTEGQWVGRLANKRMDRQKDGQEDAWEAGPRLTRCLGKHSTGATASLV